MWVALCLTMLADHRASGAVIEAWSHDYRSAPTNHFDEARAVAVDARGNVAVMGRFQNGTGQDLKSGMFTAKYAAANGALLWEKRVQSSERSFESNAIAFDSRGNVIVTGAAWEKSESIYTVKYAATDGSLLWEKRHQGPAGGDAWATRLAVDGRDNVVVTGTESNGTNHLGYTAKYAAADGTLLWENRFTIPGAWPSPSGIAIDRSGNVAVTGEFETNEADDGTLWGTYRIYTAKLAASDGALLWQQRYSRPVLG